MDEKTKRELEAIIGEMECPKGFKCFESGFDNLCSAKDIGVELFLECLEETPQHCKFSVMIAGSYLCQSPLRYYIFKKMNK